VPMIEGAPKFVGTGEASAASTEPSFLTEAPAKNILERRSPLSLPRPPVTTLQTQVDQLIGGFIAQATDWKSLCAMMAGSLSYRLGRFGAISSGVGAYCNTALPVASVAAGLTAEVSAFELTHRSLLSSFSLQASSTQPETKNLKPETQNLWHWNGPLGLKNGFFTSLTTFGALKSAGSLAQGQNLVLQHFLQDTAMVFGHQAAGKLGWILLPTESLAEQYLQAEATNLQMGAGMSLGLAISRGQLYGIERGLDLTLRGSEAGANLVFARKG